jgi:hypothetical protein
MKRLITQVGTYITGDATARAVVQYWQALTQERRADVVDIPIVSAAGEQSHVCLALGMMVPFAVIDADSTAEIDDDERAAHRLLARSRSLTAEASPAFAPGEVPDAPAAYDYPFL